MKHTGRSKINFSEHGHVAFQIKWNHEYSNIVAILLPAEPPPTGPSGGQKVKIQLFQNMVMLHFILNGITNAATW